jgi:hypothetical protein
VILIPKMPNGESRGNELGNDQQERETKMGDLSGGEQLGSKDSVRSRTSHPATMTFCVPHSGSSNGLSVVESRVQRRITSRVILLSHAPR